MSSDIDHIDFLSELDVKSTVDFIQYLSPVPPVAQEAFLF